MQPETVDGHSENIKSDGSTNIASGTILDGKYEVLDYLAAGGMGVVYRVRHTALNRDEALKTFSTIHVDAESWSRFQREARSIARLVCKNIVQVFDFGVWGTDGIPYYTMELLRGESLAEKIDRQGALNSDEAVELFKEISFGLAHAHKLGIVHRDIKPANVFLCDASGSTVKTAKIVDFGVAKLAIAQDESMQSSSVAGMIFGSPFYMSPEQILSDKIDHRSDLYSLGCSLHEALTGHPPFPGATAFATLQMHLAATPPLLPTSITSTVQGKHLQTLITKLLAKDPDDRVQTADEVVLILQKDVTRLARKLERISPEALQTNRQSDNTTDDDHHQSSSSRKILPAMLILGLLALIVCLTVGYVNVSKSKTKKVVAASAAPVIKLVANDSANSTAEFAKTVALAEPPQSRPGYYSIIQTNGSRIFHFPPGLADSSLKDIANGRISHNLQESLAVRRNPYLSLTVNESFSTNPKLFAGFRPDELRIIECSDYCSWNATHLLEISKLTSLNFLKIPELNASTNDMLLLNRLTLLYHLELPRCAAPGAGLLGLKRLDQQQLLNLDGVKGLTPVLKKLKDSKNLLDLSVRNCELDDDDMKNIADIRSIRILKIGDPQITARGIRYLTKASTLANLRIGPSCKITPDALAEGQHLSEVAVYQTGWTDSDFSELKRLLPETKIGGDKREIAE